MTRVSPLAPTWWLLRGLCAASPVASSGPASISKRDPMTRSPPLLSPSLASNPSSPLPWSRLLVVGGGGRGHSRDRDWPCHHQCDLRKVCSLRGLHSPICNIRAKNLHFFPGEASHVYPKRLFSMYSVHLCTDERGSNQMSIQRETVNRWQLVIL